VICQHCNYEGEMHADYLEAVWQTVDGTVDNYDYTGCTGHYDDGSTADECLRCPSCFSEVVTFGKHVFVPAEPRLDSLGRDVASYPYEPADFTGAEEYALEVIGMLRIEHLGARL